MPTRNVSLPEKLDQFITAKVESGDYANASEVMRTALRLLEKEEREYEVRLAALRTAIDEGLASGIAEPGVFERLDDYIEELAAGEEECRHIPSRACGVRLKSIVRYTMKTWGRAQTIRYRQDLEGCFLLLAKTPFIGRRYDFVRQGLRRFEHGKHLIFYISKPDEIFIVRVLHQDMIPTKSRSKQ